MAHRSDPRPLRSGLTKAAQEHVPRPVRLSPDGTTPTGHRPGDMLGIAERLPATTTVHGRASDRWHNPTDEIARETMV
jgi:hypothetical protein